MSSIINTIKENAASMKQALQGMGIGITHQQALEATAKQLGFTNGFSQLSAFCDKEGFEAFHEPMGVIRHHEILSKEITFTDSPTVLANGRQFVVEGDAEEMSIHVLNAAGVESMMWTADELLEDPLNCVDSILSLMSAPHMPNGGMTSRNHAGLVLSPGAIGVPLLTPGETISKRARKEMESQSGRLKFLIEASPFVEGDAISELNDYVDRALEGVSALDGDGLPTSIVANDISYQVVGHNPKQGYIAGTVVYLVNCRYETL